MTKWCIRPFVVCVLLLSFVLPISSVHAQSVGKNCSKAGALAGTKKNPLVCKKVGKKLIWQKDAVTTTTTTAAPTTTTATTTTTVPKTTTTAAPTTTTATTTTTVPKTTTTPATIPVAPAVSGQIGVAANAVDGLTVTLVSFSKIEMSSSFQYKISYTLVNNTQNKIDEGAFKLFPGSGQGLPQYGSFSEMFPGKSISRTYTFEAMKSVLFTQLSYAPDQFFAKSVPAGAIVWQVPN